MSNIASSTKLDITCEHCGSKRILFGVQIIASGFKTVLARCAACGKRPQKQFTAYNTKLFNLDELEVWNDNSISSEPCQRCGAKTGTQFHHYGPKSVFGIEDADKWATGYLCPKCHAEWHIKIRDFNWKDWRGYR
jgi:DNA-directed RNA polymerase subunit RPC12/RpoP/Zn ribbon nucleic-acid-binding protein